MVNPIKYLASKTTTSTPNPRKVPASGSTLNANGLIDAPTLDQELGSAQPTRIQDLVPELATAQQRTLTFNKMMNDSSVDVSMRVTKTPVLGATFYMDPWSDADLDQTVAEFVEANLLEGMSSPLLNTMEDILKFFEDGYSTLEKVYELRQWASKKSGANAKQYTMLKKLGVRPAATIGTIDYDDNGGPLGITQNAIRADKTVDEVAIDISKLLIFTFNRTGGDLTGKSLLRTAYPHWYYKTHFYKIDGVQKERHGMGVPKAKMLPGSNKKDVDIIRNLLRNLRTNEEAFIIEPMNVEISFAELKGQPVDVISSALHHNMMIMMNVLAQFLTLGVESGSGGGRATAGAGVDIFMKTLKYIANYICDVINMYLIPELVVWNFPTKNFPKLKVRNIGETQDLQRFASGLANILAQGGITMDVETEDWIRNVFDMPTKKENAVPTQQPAQPANAAPTNGAVPANGNGAKPQQKGNVKPNADKGGNKPAPANAADAFTQQFFTN